MQHSDIAHFLETPYGQGILRKFTQYKADIEDPAQWVVDLWKRRAASDPQAPSSILNYLDIGGGAGDRTLQIGREVSCQHIDFVEPSSLAGHSFTENADRANQPYTWHPVPFEEYRTTRKFDLITALHVWYYVSLDELKRLPRLLTQGGRAVLLMDSKNDAILKLQHLCEREIYGSQSNSAEDVCEYLERNQVRHGVLKYEGDMDGLLDAGKLTQKASTILSLVAHMPKREIPSFVKKSARDLLQDLSRDDTYPSRRWLIEIRQV